MFNVPIKDVITWVVRDEVKNTTRSYDYHYKDGTYTTDGIMVEVRLIVKNDKKSVYRSYLLAFCNDVSVFVAENTEGDFFEQIAPKRWKNTSNHDSCWSSDGLSILSKAYFEMCEEVDPDVAPIKLSSEAKFGLFGRLYTKVRMTLKQKSGNNYGFELVKIKRSQ